MDKFKWDLVYNKAKELKNDISKMLDEREKIMAKKQSTGGVDYRLKSKNESLKKEINQLEKVIYLYENNDVSVKSVPDKEKRKRILQIRPFINESKKT